MKENQVRAMSVPLNPEAPAFEPRNHNENQGGLVAQPLIYTSMPVYVASFGGDEPDCFIAPEGTRGLGVSVSYHPANTEDSRDRVRYFQNGALILPPSSEYLNCKT